MTYRKPIPHVEAESARSLLNPMFVIAAVILMAAAIGLRPGIARLADRYKKQPVPIRRSLKLFDVADLPSFERLSDHPSLWFVILPGDAGTDEATWLFLQDKREKRSKRKPRQVTALMTYYNDPADKVPHTPEICYRQTGAVVEQMKTVTIELSGPTPSHREIEACQIQLRQGPLRAIILYVFVVNGEIVHDREQVRWRLGMPGDWYTYFSKVEIIGSYLPDEGPEPAIQSCKQLMSELLPTLINQYFPDDDALRKR